MSEIPTSQGASAQTGDFRIELPNWPIQLQIIPVDAPFFKEANLLFAADCSAFAHQHFHSHVLPEHDMCVIGCPKFDNAALYEKKLEEVILKNDVKSITVAYMEVPCCNELRALVQNAVAASGGRVKVRGVRIAIDGDVLADEIL